MAKTKQDFEQSLQELEVIVNKLEQGEINLQDSLLAFEQGVKLFKFCQSELDSASKKIETLSKHLGEKQPLDEQ